MTSEVGKGQTIRDTDDFRMTSIRPEQPDTFDFREGTEVSRVAPEPQRGESQRRTIEHENGDRQEAF